MIYIFSLGSGKEPAGREASLQAQWDEGLPADIIIVISNITTSSIVMLSSFCLSVLL